MDSVRGKYKDMLVVHNNDDAHRISELEAQVAGLKEDQSDWRKGVGFIASCLGEDGLACVYLGEKALEIRVKGEELEQENAKLRAELEAKRLRWQTGPVPKDGYYWFCQLLQGKFNGPFLSVYTNGKFFIDNYAAHYSIDDDRWAGPIPEPEDAQ